MISVAATLAVASGLHLSGTAQGRSAPFDAVHAGIAEAVIGVVLVAAAFAMLLLPAPARSIGIAATGFAVAGFLLGLRFTTLGGHRPDIAYHLTVLPVLLASLLILVRTRGHTQRKGALQPHDQPRSTIIRTP
jgi:Na+-transporting NADH:ubiquinone oxidoreductase subunit NqrB